MALERKLLAVPAQTFTANGTSDGQVIIAKPGLFKARQFVFVGAPSLATIELEIKRIVSGTIFVGPKDNNPDTRTNVSAYLSGAAFIFANEQVRPFIPKDELIPNYQLEDYEHEEEPTIARRSILVDAEGEKVDVIVVSGVRRLAVDTGAASSGTTSSGITQISGVVSFQRPVQVHGTAPDSAPAEGFPVRVGSVAKEQLQNSGVSDGEAVDVISDPFRRVYVNDSANIGLRQTATGISTLRGPLLLTQLPGRKKIQIQNLNSVLGHIGSAPIFMGDQDVEASGVKGGIRILPNGTNTLDAGDNLKFYVVSLSGVQDVRVLELA